MEPRQSRFEFSGNFADLAALVAIFRGEDAALAIAMKNLSTSIERAERLGADPAESSASLQGVSPMAISPQVQAFADRLNAATNELASDLQALRDKVAAGTPLTAEELAMFDAAISRLEAMGVDPVTPIPTL